ncbi:MAG: DNA mismatch repair endonuclease MutL [Myxococcota bacterium]|nr:DNA mismatch repair endonuclease MutL [Myxococcota bacterium]
MPQSTQPASEVRRLPDALVDQIAAGEVVERPASVVKELVENAVDAGARRIRVEVREGGAALVAVSDDGLGMTPANARLALERHATSKLSSLSDLRGIASYGFRGEALPAIASVSRFRLRTRPHDAQEGFEIRVDAGVEKGAGAAGCPPGTRIEVADLFATIPARRKFLKTAGTEWGHIADWLSRAALALPAVHFDVIRDDRPALSWPAVSDPLDRIAAVLSEREAESLQLGEAEGSGIRVRAFASHPEHHRATAAGLHLFVNGRPVRDRLLRHAILQVYRDLLPRGRYPTVLAFLEVEPGAVDVNVHPAKWEVRFVDPQSVHRTLGAAVRAAIERRGWMGEGAAPEPMAAPTSYASSPRPGAGLIAEAPARTASFLTDWSVAGRGGAAMPVDASPTSAPTPPLRFGELTVLGQLHATYLMAETKEGVLLIDQHAAHERVLYERLRAAWLEGGVERQALLVPITVELDASRRSALEESRERVLALGFEAEPFGESAVVLRAVPALLADRDPVGILRALADELAEAGPGASDTAPTGSDTRLLDAADKVFASLACHAARRAGDRLEPAEQRALLDALDAIPWAPTCPHGRPVAVPLSLEEIERRFSRR